MKVLNLINLKYFFTSIIVILKPSCHRYYESVIHSHLIIVGEQVKRIN